jgi:hypothetical protein
MPDGSQQPLDPAAQRAQEQMREWKEKQHEGEGGGWWSTIGNTIGDMMAAAEAGAFAVSPDTGAAIIKQLNAVKDQVDEMQTVGSLAAFSQRLGGGYAQDIATFNKQVTDEGLGAMLRQFSGELDQLKAAVQKSMGNYSASDSGNSRRVDQAGDGL